MRTRHFNFAGITSLDAARSAARLGLSAMTIAVVVMTTVVVTACGDRSASPAASSAPTPAPTAVNAAAPIASRPAASNALTMIATSATNAKLSFALVAGACVQTACAAALELVRDGQRLDASTLDFAASSPKLEARKSEGVQNLFGSKTALPIWIAGEGEGAVATALQAVRLSADRVGVLVHQSVGFEHVKMRRDLFIADGDALKKIWSKADGQGPVRSYADVVPRDATIDDIVMIEGISTAPNEPDRIIATRYMWDESTKTLKDAGIESLPVVVAATFASAERARAKFADACFSNYWVIRDDQIGGETSRFALAMVASDASAASVEMNRQCDPETVATSKTKPARRLARFKPATALF